MKGLVQNKSDIGFLCLEKTKKPPGNERLLWFYGTEVRHLMLLKKDDVWTRIIFFKSCGAQHIPKLPCGAVKTHMLINNMMTLKGTWLSGLLNRSEHHI